MEECEGTLQVTLPDYESLFWGIIFTFSPVWPVLTKVELDDFEDGGMSGESAGDSCGVMRHHFGIQFSNFHPFCLVLFFIFIFFARLTRFLLPGPLPGPGGSRTAVDGF